MKRRIMYITFGIILLLVIVLSLVLFNVYKNDNDDKKTYVLIGKITSIESNENLTISSEIGNVIVHYENCYEFNVNYNIKITYDGGVLESNPAQISAILIEIIDN